ncbi:MAG TPA: hypothetical protein VKD72_04935 [Gemmataceae bacterium]|nr:hypothetical protein [Gemmataceae bacterium]
MERTIKVLFRRDPSRDRQRGPIRYEGYQLFWPDGSPGAVSLDAFCERGQRLLGLDRCLDGCAERLIELVCCPLVGRDDALTRLPGHRVRRFYLERQGDVGRLHFLNGTPTDVAFAVHRDDPRVVRWIGLEPLADGDRQWLDLAARPVTAAPPSE